MSPVTTSLDQALPRPPIPTRVRGQVEAFFVLRRNPLELWGQAAYEEGVLGGRFLGRDQLLLNDPDAIRHVLVDNHANYGRNAATRRILQPVLGDGLFLAEGDAWKRQRRTIAPSMAPRALDVLARHVAVASAETEHVLDGKLGRVVELLPILQQLALAIAARSMFSLEVAAYGQQLRALLFRYGTQYAQPGILDLMLPPDRRSPTDRLRERFRVQWLAMIDRIIDAREAAPPTEGAPRDLFDMLAGARDPETGAGFDRALLRDEVATMILAGHETTAVALFWSLFVAARRPEWQAELAEEALAVDLTPNRASDAIDHLPNLRAHVDETLRLYPPAFLITREAMGADMIAGQRVAPGTVVSIAPFVLHRHTRHWSDPDHFDPSRFLPGATPPARYTYMPFGAGPRICVGARFALTEAVVVLARLLARYRVELAAGSEHVVPRAIVTTQPDRPVRFILRRRVH